MPLLILAATAVAAFFLLKNPSPGLPAATIPAPFTMVIGPNGHYGIHFYAAKKLNEVDITPMLSGIIGPNGIGSNLARLSDYMMGNQVVSEWMVRIDTNSNAGTATVPVDTARYATTDYNSGPPYPMAFLDFIVYPS